MPVSGTHLHLVEAVAYIRVAEFVQPDGTGVVGLYRNERHAAAAIIVGQPFDARLV